LFRDVSLNKKINILFWYAFLTKIDKNLVLGRVWVHWVGPWGPLGLGDPWPLGTLGLGDPWALGTLGPWGPLGLGDPSALGTLRPWGPWALGTPGPWGPLGLGDPGPCGLRFFFRPDVFAAYDRMYTGTIKKGLRPMPPPL